MTLGIREQKRSAFIQVVFIGALASMLVGCGGEETEELPAQSMLGSQASPQASASGVNRPPVISQLSLRPERPKPGRRVQATAMVKDPDGDPTTVKFHWQTVHGRRLGEGASFDTSGLRPGSTLEVVAIASDGQTESDSAVQTFHLSEPSVDIGFVGIDTSQGTKPGDVLKAAVEFVNDDSGRVKAELQWKINGEIAGSEDTLETSELEPGDRIDLRARIGGANSRSQFVSSRSVILTRGTAPRILSKPLAGIEGGLFRYQIKAGSDESAAKFSYALLSGPEGMTVDPQSGLVEWRPTLEQRGRFDIEVSATDQWGTGIAQSFAIVADAPPASPR